MLAAWTAWNGHVDRRVYQSNGKTVRSCVGWWRSVQVDRLFWDSVWSFAIVALAWLGVRGRALWIGRSVGKTIGNVCHDLLLMEERVQCK